MEEVPIGASANKGTATQATATASRSYGHSDTDIILVGGGLANCLLALRLRERLPNLRLTLLERGPTLGGNHTWSFHEGDLDDAQHAWIAPLVAHRWASHEVRFPKLTRHLDAAYQSITSERLHEAITTIAPTAATTTPADPGLDIRLDCDVTDVFPDRVTFADGATLQARIALDGRGWGDGRDHFEVGIQKFVGHVVRCAGPHGLEHAILMDAQVEQREGFRFIYTLPLDDRHLLVEDTRYSDSANLDREEMRISLRKYIEAQGFGPGGHEVVREEEGVLPVVLAGDIDAFWREAGDDVPRTGMRAALFHPTTGYSLPDAVRMADRICDWLAGGDNDPNNLDPRRLAARIREHSIDSWRRGSFFRFLNRMMFRAADPERRYRVLQHFYTKPDALVRRFYAGRITGFDKVRLLTGVPPVPVLRAVPCIPDRPSKTSS